jgi:hypothetical protein
MSYDTTVTCYHWSCCASLWFKTSGLALEHAPAPTPTLTLLMPSGPLSCTVQVGMPIVPHTTCKGQKSAAAAAVAAAALGSCVAVQHCVEKPLVYVGHTQDVVGTTTVDNPLCAQGTVLG